MHSNQYTGGLRRNPNSVCAISVPLLRRHAVQVRSLERRMPIGGEVAVTEIVSKDEHEVWLIGTLYNACNKSPETQKEDYRESFSYHLYFLCSLVRA